MGKYLKKFQTDKDYQAFKSDGTKMLIPNVSYIKNGKYCYFTPLNGTPSEPEQPEVVYPTIHATFNATSENMLAFLETGNMKSLKIDGNQIDVGAPVPTQGSLNIAGNGITIDMGTGETVVSPENLLNISEADFMSLKFTPTDKNISFDDYNAFILIMEIEGQFQPMLLSMENFASMATHLGVSYQSESHTIMVPQYMLKYMEIAAQMKPTGITGALAKVNIQSQTFENFLDTTCNYYTVSGGLPGQYVFDAEGTHEVEIELTNNSPTDMLFATSCVSNIISMKNIKSIDSHTFTSCPYLEEIVIPNDVTEIHCMALSNTPITEFTIPDSVTRIGEYTFRECANLASVTIPESVTKIGDGAFYNCESLTSITIPNSVTSIGAHAFSDCSSLTSITIPNGVTEIGYGTFYNCDSLASITIPDSVTSIGDSAFYNCNVLTSVDLGNGVTTIGNYAFDNCKSLTSVTIPDSVTLIGNYVFQSCSSLASVYCKATTPPTSSDSVIFNGNASGRKIYVPMASVDAYKSATGWSNHANDIEGYNF